MAIDWTDIFKKYRGLWIGLKKDQKTVIASGKSVKQVMEISNKKGVKLPYLFRVPSKITSHVGFIQNESSLS